MGGVPYKGRCAGRLPKGQGPCPWREVRRTSRGRGLGARRLPQRDVTHSVRGGPYGGPSRGLPLRALRAGCVQLASDRGAEL